jgi:hypothetical protein
VAAGKRAKRYPFLVYEGASLRRRERVRQPLLVGRWAEISGDEKVVYLLDQGSRWVGDHLFGEIGRRLRIAKAGKCMPFDRLIVWGGER